MSFINNTDSPDWLGGVGYGGQLLVNDLNHTFGGAVPVTFGPFFVGNVETTIVNFANNTINAAAMLTLSWASSPTANAYAEAVYYLSSPLSDKVLDGLTNKGPYLTVSILSTSGANITCDTIVSVAKGPNAELTANGDMVLLRFDALAVGAGLSVSQWCSFHVPGPAHVWFSGSVAPGISFTIEEYTPAAVYVPTARWDTAVSPSKNINDQCVLVNNTWRVTVANSTGAGVTASCCIVSGR